MKFLKQIIAIILEALIDEYQKELQRVEVNHALGIEPTPWDELSLAVLELRMTMVGEFAGVLLEDKL
jgi:hypothetical protein